MKCNRIKCYFIGKKIEKDKYSRIDELEQQLEKCNECVFQEPMNEIKNRTRNIVGAKYVKRFWSKL